MVNHAEAAVPIPEHMKPLEETILEALPTIDPLIESMIYAFPDFPSALTNSCKG